MKKILPIILLLFVSQLKAQGVYPSPKNFKLHGLYSALPRPIQPKDSLLVALAKLQAQIDDLRPTDAIFIKNQNSYVQTANSYISGTYRGTTGLFGVGNVSTWSGSAFFARFGHSTLNNDGTYYGFLQQSTGFVAIGANGFDVNTNSVINGTLRVTSRTFSKSLNLDKDSIQTSSAGSVLTLGIDTTTGNVVKGAFGAITNTFNPTYTNVSGTSAATSIGFTYVRNGNFVDVYGNVSITTTSSSQNIFRLSLPIPSNLANGVDLIGTGTAFVNGAVSEAIAISADTANDEATISYYTIYTGGNIYLHFRYKIL